MSVMEEDKISLTDSQKKARRGRSVALALALVAFVVIIYVVTVVKMGPAILDRPM